LPICLILVYFTWPWFVDSWRLNEESSNAGGLLRWPVKLLLPVGFLLMALQGVSELIKRIAALMGRAELATTYEAPLHELGPRQHGPPDVRGHDGFHDHRLSGGVRAGSHRPVLRLHRHRAWPDPPRLSRQPDLSALRHHLERAVARDPVLHAHGRDPRAL